MGEYESAFDNEADLAGAGDAAEGAPRPASSAKTTFTDAAQTAQQAGHGRYACAASGTSRAINMGDTGCQRAVSFFS